MSQAITTGAAGVRGVLAEKRSDGIVLALPGTDYRLHLAIDPDQADRLPAPGQRVAGWVSARAKRVDVVGTGGRYIEPVYGRPRRVQGVVAGIDPGGGTVAVRCAAGCTITCQLTAPGQRPAQFAPGQLVSFDIERGARFALDQAGQGFDPGYAAAAMPSREHRSEPADKAKDAGPLTQRGITGREPPAGDTKIDE